jgi:hypothetical protein
MLLSLVVNKYFTIQRFALWPEWVPWPPIWSELWKKYWLPPSPPPPPPPLQPTPNRGPLLPPQHRLVLMPLYL